MLWTRQKGYRNCAQLLSQANSWTPLLGSACLWGAQVLPLQRVPQVVQMQVVQIHFRNEWLGMSGYGKVHL